MNEKVSKTLDGAMGHFWTNLDGVLEIEKAWPGYASLENGRFTVRTIKRPDESLGFGGRLELPEAVYGATEVGGLAAYDIRPGFENSVWGGSKVSVRSYRAGGFAIGLSPDDLASDKVSEIRVDFLGLVEWAGVQGGKVTSETGPNGRLKSLS
uniref:hypothetical protein n=1 Tax=Rhodococcus hoagii TaxID=43767 RepID=UPI000B3286A6